METNTYIKIVDDFLEEKDLEKLQLCTIIDHDYERKWQLQASDVLTDLKFLMSQVYKIDELEGDEFICTDICNKVKEQLPGKYEVTRIYFNGQWNGREGDFHTDGCDITALIYINPYQYGWGGFTEIMTEPSPTLIYPLTNRLLLFSGHIKHKAYSLAYQQCPLRVSLAFKFDKIIED